MFNFLREIIVSAIIEAKHEFLLDKRIEYPYKLC